ncbi:MAG TPA: FlgD immunoglobulin-like domain containing protein [Candidatus Krumholzibacteria bacterium]|nr:FlgD immunoglobulin-like domain containing protein [Candidatus Krumholzibacteria bacterium]
MAKRVLLLVSFLLLLGSNINSAAHAQAAPTRYGAASDGDLTINSTVVVNTYAYLVGTAAAGSFVVSVNSTSGFLVGNEVLIIQTQNGLGNGAAGQHEFAMIASINGNDLLLAAGLSASYYSGTFNSYLAEAAQVVRVPQFAHVTIEPSGVITAPAWDGHSGGIVVFRVAHELIVDGAIDVVGKGFRGGWDVRSKKEWGAGYRGEGTVGGPGPDDIFTNQNGGGGGGAEYCWSGNSGGGGGHGTAGEGGQVWGNYCGGQCIYCMQHAVGGLVVGDTVMTRIHFGGGGGSGGVDGDNPDSGGHGGVGGGIILVAAPTITGTGTLAASGANAPATPTGETGGGGGGAGGSIFVQCQQTPQASLTITSTGGAGAQQSYGRIGGDGGEGRIRVQLDLITPAAAVECPGDLHIPGHSTVRSVSLVGFRVTNRAAVPLAFDYDVAADGPLTLTDKGNPGSISGTTPVLDPGATYYPPEAGLIIPAVRDYAIEVIRYQAREAGAMTIEDSCLTFCMIEVPVPVLIQRFTATAAGYAVELVWTVASDEHVAGYRIYRGLGDASMRDVSATTGLVPAGATSYTDVNVAGGQTYRYAIGVVLDNGSETMSQIVSVVTRKHTTTLYQNRPNPFNPTTTISFELDSRTRAVVTIYDAEGRLVRTVVDDVLEEGYKEYAWDGTDVLGHSVGSGIYFCRLIVDGRTFARKMVLLK